MALYLSWWAMYLSNGQCGAAWWLAGLVIKVCGLDTKKSGELLSIVKKVASK